MDWSEIALLTGNPSQHDIGLCITFTLPDATCNFPATDNQLDSIKRFYQTDFGELRDSQAHALLSCREYSRISADTLFKRYPPVVRDMMARAIAAFVLSDERMTQFVTNWSDRNFQRGTGSPRVRGTPCFADVEQFASYLEGSLEMNGWTMAHLKMLRLR